MLDWTARQHVEHVREVEGSRRADQGVWRERPNTERIERSWADPSAAQAIADLRRQHDVLFGKGDNTRQWGIDCLADRLTCTPMGGRGC